MSHLARLVFPFVGITLVFAVLFAIIACSAEVSEQGDVSSVVDEDPSTLDEEGVELEEYRRRLLDVAFDAASAMPSNPHIKSRSRVQEEVVLAAIELGQARWARNRIDKIGNWRQATALAHLAMHYSKNGRTGGVDSLLSRAAAVSEEMAENENGQAWRRDRIRAAIAHTHYAMGNLENAASFASGLVDSEAGVLESTVALDMAQEDLDAKLVEFDEVFVGGSFERVRSALDCCVALFGRFYGNEDHRRKLERRVRFSYAKLPIDVRVDLMIALSRSAADNGDRAKASSLLDDTSKICAAVRWLPEHEIPLTAKIAEARFLAGQRTRAIRDLEGILEFYENNRVKIVNIYRADALLPVATAFFTAGDHEMARLVFARALDESVVNPNSRPRAEDFSATCTAMAKIGCEPDQAMWDQIRQIRQGLGAPW